MIDADALAPHPVLETGRLRLEPLGPERFDDTWRLVHDEEGALLTGTTQQFTEDQVRTHLERIADADDRADWAVVDRSSGEYLGEIVLNDLDEHNGAMNVRIALLLDVTGRGYGTEAMSAVLDFAFGAVGLHRVGLDVFDMNERAIRSYEKVGFVREGRQRHTLHWDGRWYDSILMGVLDSDPRPAIDGRSAT